MKPSGVHQAEVETHEPAGRNMQIAMNCKLNLHMQNDSLKSWNVNESNLQMSDKT